MNSTISPYETTVEQEINRWSSFLWALRKEDREAFEQLMEIYVNNAHTNEAASNPFPFEPMVMSILTAQQKIIKRLEKDLETLKQQEPTWSSAAK